MDSLYFKVLKINDMENIIERFHDTLIDTNRGYNFFVDWPKIKKNAEKYKIELNILNTLIGSKDFESTNARKNRSGDAMELVLKPIIEDIISKHKSSYKMLFQKNFKHLEKQYGIKVTPSIANRKADFIIIKNDNKVINIEVNFFSGSGSKPQEIVDSYIERQNELNENGFEFIWVTDGIGWREQKNQLHKGFERVKYLLNLHFVRMGLLEEILWRI